MNKILTVLCSLAVLSTCSVMTAFAAEENVLLGDANGDGVINEKDAVVICSDYAHYISVGDAAEAEKYNHSIADIDEDGVETVKDAVCILKYSAYRYANADTTLSLKDFYLKDKNESVSLDDDSLNKSEFEGRKASGQIPEDAEYDPSIDYSNYVGHSSAN